MNANPRASDTIWPDPHALGAATDLYQLTMAAGYAQAGKGEERAVFELFVRKLPPGRSYLIFAGLGPVLNELPDLCFSDEQIDMIRSMPVFRHTDPTWFEELSRLRFRGDLWSVPEGTAVFEGEPLLRVEARLPEAQWIETYLLSNLSYPTSVASKAARIVEAAEGRAVYEFGTRRGHGPLSGYIAARSSYLAGFDGTSHVDAAGRLGIPCVGTMAHSWVQSFDSEKEAFSAFARVYPDATLLVDTYDTLAAVEIAATIEPRIKGIRIDSGDLTFLSINARRILDDAGRPDVKITVSGDLNEKKIRDLIRGGAKIDSFGVGTELITSRDAPALGMVYKLVELEGKGRVKKSPEKASYPFAKQVFRKSRVDGRFLEDRVVRFGETADGEPLLVRRIKGGKLTAKPPELSEIRRRVREQIGRLPRRLLELDAPADYPVRFGESLKLP